MPQPSNGQRHAESRETGPPSSLGDPITEAEALRELLAEAQSRLGRLLASLKHQRRHARVVRAAVDSIRQLPPLVP